MKILQSPSNIKNRAILSLVYCAGLRVGEIVKLKSEDIDSDRRVIHIRGSKGRKDRYTLLAETVLDVLRKYWKKYIPEKWLFERAREGTFLSTRTADKIFKNVCKKLVSIKKGTDQKFCVWRKNLKLNI